MVGTSSSYGILQIWVGLKGCEMKAWRVIDIISKAVDAKGINMINSDLPVAKPILKNGFRFSWMASELFDYSFKWISQVVHIKRSNAKAFNLFIHKMSPLAFAN